MTLSKRAILKDINSVVEHSRNQIRFHRQDIENQENFINCICIIVQKEAPEFVVKMKEIKKQFLKLLSYEKLLADAEERYADDLNDLSARFEVIYRLGEELAAGKKKVKDSRLRIDKLRKDLEYDSLKGAQKKDKIEAELARSIDAKKEAIEELEAKYVEFIDQRGRFATFKTNRLQHAFQSLGFVISTAMNEYAQNGQVFQNLIKETQDQIDQLLEAGPPPEKNEEEETAENTATETPVSEGTTEASPNNQ